MRVLLSIVCAALCFSTTAQAAIETKAKQAFMIDYDTGQVLLAKEADTPMHPSSMSKLMTTYVLFDRMQQGRIKPSDTFLVSEKAWRTQGSKMFVELGKQIAVEDLIRGIIIQSGNDACVVVAEGISGSEEAFAQEMNRMAKDIGLSDTTRFVNSTGLPDEVNPEAGQMMTARDLAILAKRSIADHPEYYPYYAEKEFTWHGIKQPNRNRLIGNDIGVDGIKTGHTEVAGYGITLSAKDPKSGRRLVLVINGLESDNDRINEGDRLLRYGLREFENKTVVKAGEPVADVNVWYGDSATVPVAAEKDLTLTLPVAAQEQTAFTLTYTGPVQAPIAKGAHIADLKVQAPGQEPYIVPLVAAQDVGKMGIFQRMFTTLRYLITQ